ncbi:hypothetical protein [Embleya sp. NPDC020886]|uniref:hypothetical protein n=1 Tax=Embleya sp. NPDC020886 TaxID=3363980 RepID=UPI00378EDAF5
METVRLWLIPGIAFLAIAVSVFTLVRSVRRDRREDADKEEERRTEQAVRVAAWTGDHQADCPSGSQYSYHPHHCLTHNGSQLPVYDVILHVVAPLAELLPGEDPVAMIAIGLVAPGETLVTEVSHCLGVDSQGRMPVGVWFTDMRGTRWYRSPAGDLSEWTDNEVSVGVLVTH